MSKIRNLTSKVIYSVLLSSCILVSFPATAGIIHYDLSYRPDQPALGGDNTYVDVKVFFDRSDITGIGIEDIVALELEVTYNGPVTNDVDLVFNYANDDTHACSFVCQGIPNYVPITGRFNNGGFTGLLQGRQNRRQILTPGGGSQGIVHIGFGVTGGGSHGGGITFNAGAKPHKANAEIDVFSIIGFSGPFAVSSVPEPSTLILMSLGLAGLSFTRRKQLID